jgi:hypothetical protein
MLDDEFAPSLSSTSAIPSTYFFVTTLNQNLTGTINFITTLVGSVGSAEYQASVDEGSGLSVSTGGALVCVTRHHHGTTGPSPVILFAPRVT